MTVRPLIRARASTADGVLVAAALLLVVDSFLPWQRLCCPVDRTAWQGNGELAGGVMAGLATALIALVTLGVAGRSLPPPLPHAYVTDAAATGVAVFGLLKVVLVAGRHPAMGAWIGLGLVILVAGEAWWRVVGRRSQHLGAIRS